MSALRTFERKIRVEPRLDASGADFLFCPEAFVVKIPVKVKKLRGNIIY